MTFPCSYYFSPVDSLTNKAQATQSNIEDKKRVDCNANTVLNNATAAHDTNTGRKRPGDQNNVNWDPSYSWEVKC
jgi:hypothetical protein